MHFGQLSQAIFPARKAEWVLWRIPPFWAIFMASWANHYKVFQYLSFSGLGEREKEDSETFMRANYSRKEYNLPWNPPTLVCIGRPLQKAVHRSKAQTPDLLERSWPLCCLQEGVYLVGLTALKLPFCKLFALSLDNSAQAGIEDLSWLETFMEILQMVP